jgi:hypothetical protein
MPLEHERWGKRNTRSLQGSFHQSVFAVVSIQAR